MLCYVMLCSVMILRNVMRGGITERIILKHFAKDKIYYNKNTGDFKVILECNKGYSDTSNNLQIDGISKLNESNECLADQIYTIKSSQLFATRAFNLLSLFLLFQAEGMSYLLTSCQAYKDIDTCSYSYLPIVAATNGTLSIMAEKTPIAATVQGWNRIRIRIRSRAETVEQLVEKRDYGIRNIHD